MTKSRIYVVTIKESAGDISRLIKAATATQAVNFAAKPRIIASVPTQDELVTLGSKGIKVEDATTDAA